MIANLCLLSYSHPAFPPPQIRHSLPSDFLPPRPHHKQHLIFEAIRTSRVSHWSTSLARVLSCTPSCYTTLHEDPREQGLTVHQLGAADEVRREWGDA